MFSGTARWAGAQEGVVSSRFGSMAINEGEGYTEILVADVGVPIDTFSHSIASRHIAANRSNGRIYVGESGVYAFQGQLVYNIGNQDADAFLALWNVNETRYVMHSLARYGKGGVGDNLVLVGMGPLIIGHFELHVGCSISTSMDIIEADMNIWKIANLGSIREQYGQLT